MKWKTTGIPVHVLWYFFQLRLHTESLFFCSRNGFNHVRFAQLSTNVQASGSTKGKQYSESHIVTSKLTRRVEDRDGDRDTLILQGVEAGSFVRCPKYKRFEQV